MGSFYTICSVTGQTICDGQEMVVQFMLPSRSFRRDPSVGQVFVESFLRVAKDKGLEKAIESFEESTKTWESEAELGQKGMLVSNDGAFVDWVPFGPAIRGYYDDCGDIRTSDDGENQKRIQILEGLLFGIPFDSIMGASTDNRWYTYGMKDKSWRLKGIDKDLPEPAMMLLKKMSVTYMHASVYDELASSDFSPEDGKMKSKYEKEWKNEYLDEIRKKLPKGLKKLKNTSKMTNLDLALLRDIGVFRNLNQDLSLIYLACMARENCGIDWFMETLGFMYSLSGMCLTLRPSQYGSQHQNWMGWMRINQALDPKIKETREKYGYNEDEEENED